MSSPGHEWTKHERDGWSVCSRCGMVRNYDRETTTCSGALPKIRQRSEIEDCGQDGVCRLSPGCNRHWEERNRELVRERDEARAFLRRTAMTGGSIVSSAAMTATQIAIARAADRMLVTPDGHGFVYIPGPRFCACGRVESDCDQSRASCPNGYEQAHVRPWTQPAVRDEGTRSPAREDVALTVASAFAYSDQHRAESLTVEYQGEGDLWYQMRPSVDGECEEWMLRKWCVTGVKTRAAWRDCDYGVPVWVLYLPARLVPLSDADAPPESRGPIGGAS